MSNSNHPGGEYLSTSNHKVPIKMPDISQWLTDNSGQLYVAIDTSKANRFPDVIPQRVLDQAALGPMLQKSQQTLGTKLENLTTGPKVGTATLIHTRGGTTLHCGPSVGPMVHQINSNVLQQVSNNRGPVIQHIVNGPVRGQQQVIHQRPVIQQRLPSSGALIQQRATISTAVVAASSMQHRPSTVILPSNSIQASNAPRALLQQQQPRPNSQSVPTVSVGEMGETVVHQQGSQIVINKNNNNNNPVVATHHVMQQQQQHHQSSLGTLASAASCQVQLPLNNLVCGDCSVRFEDGQVFFQHWLENHCKLEEPPPAKHNDNLPLEQCGGCGHVFVTGTPQYAEHQMSCLPASGTVGPDNKALKQQQGQQVPPGGVTVAPGSKRKLQQHGQQQQSDGNDVKRGGRVGKLLSGQARFPWIPRIYYADK